MPLEHIQEYHNFIFPTYYGQKTYREAAFPEDAPSNTLIRIPGRNLSQNFEDLYIPVESTKAFIQYFPPQRLFAQNCPKRLLGFNDYILVQGGQSRWEEIIMARTFMGGTMSLAAR